MPKQRANKPRLSLRKNIITAALLLIAAASSCGAAMVVLREATGLGMAGIAVYIAALYALFALALTIRQRDVASNPRSMAMIAILLMSMPWLQIVCNMLDIHITPMAIAAMLTAMLINERAGVSAALLLAGVSGVFAVENGALGMAAYVMCVANAVTGITAIYALRKFTTRGSAIAAGGIGGLVGGVCTLALYFSQGAPVGDAMMAAGCVLFSALFSALLVVGSLSVWESVFDVATNARLNELLNSNNPLLKQLMYEAPGTYQHSMNVAALAEGAAERIGANALLARTAACYHDVGKLRRPLYFMENQHGENIHDTLPPAESAAIIIAHQRDGAALLAKHKLPSAVIRIASEHHGSSLMTYFYHKAAQTGAEVNAKSFCYTGANPTTAESAIVMLADCCEAAVRSLGECTREARETMVNKVVWSKFTGEERLLSGVPLTFSQVSDIERSFNRTFDGLMHDRIEYPEAAK